MHVCFLLSAILSIGGEDDKPRFKGDVVLKDAARFARHLKGDLEEKQKIAIRYSTYAIKYLSSQEADEAVNMCCVIGALRVLKNPLSTKDTKLHYLRRLRDILGKKAYAQAAIPPLIPVKYRGAFASWAKRDLKEINKLCGD
jgi:hypothetical protein